MMTKGSCWLFDYFDGKGYDLSQVARQFIRPRTFARDITSNSTSRILPYALLWWPEEYGDWKIWTDSQIGQGLAHQFAESNPWRFCVLAAMGMKIDVQDKHGNTPLHLSTSARCYQKIIELHGDLRTLNNFGLTPLARQVFNNCRKLLLPPSGSNTRLWPKRRIPLKILKNRSWRSCLGIIHSVLMKYPGRPGLGIWT